jgi:hypothetical protein
MQKHLIMVMLCNFALSLAVTQPFFEMVKNGIFFCTSNALLFASLKFFILFSVMNSGGIFDLSLLSLRWQKAITMKIQKGVKYVCVCVREIFTFLDVYHHEYTNNGGKALDMFIRWWW